MSRPVAEQFIESPFTAQLLGCLMPQYFDMLKCITVNRDERKRRNKLILSKGFDSIQEERHVFGEATDSKGLVYALYWLAADTELAPKPDFSKLQQVGRSISIYGYDVITMDNITYVLCTHIEEEKKEYSN